MTNLQQIFFNELTEAEALKEYRAGHEVYIVHDDLAESLVENEAEILDCQETLGQERTEQDTNHRKLDAFLQIYDKIEKVKECLVDTDPEIKEHYDCEQDLQDAMTAINYIEGLGKE